MRGKLVPWNLSFIHRHVESSMKHQKDAVRAAVKGEVLLYSLVAELIPVYTVQADSMQRAITRKSQRIRSQNF